MPERLEVTRDINAPPEAVYGLVADVSRMGEWSDECVACAWRDGWSGPTVGAVFDGHNRSGTKEWTTQGTVVEAEPGRAFTFQVSMQGFHYATWGYRFEPTERGCRVTEWTEDLRPDSALALGARISGVEDRADRKRSAERNRRAMLATLDRIAAAVESQPAV